MTYVFIYITDGFIFVLQMTINYMSRQNDTLMQRYGFSSPVVNFKISASAVILCIVILSLTKYNIIFLPKSQINWFYILNMFVSEWRKSYAQYIIVNSRNLPFITYHRMRKEKPLKIVADHLQSILPGEKQWCNTLHPNLLQNNHEVLICRS